MCTPLACPDYYGASAPSRAFGRRRAYPTVPGGSRAAGNDAGWFPCSLRIDRSAWHPALPRQHRHGYAADLHRGLPTGTPSRLTESATHTGWPCTAPRPISTRFEPVPRLRSFNTGSSRIPSDLARRTRPVWQYQTVPALSALLPALPGVSRIRLRPAPARLLRQPGEEVLHLLRFPAPHGAPAPRGAPGSSRRTGRLRRAAGCSCGVPRRLRGRRSSRPWRAGAGRRIPGLSSPPPARCWHP